MRLVAVGLAVVACGGTCARTASAWTPPAAVPATAGAVVGIGVSRGIAAVGDARGVVVVPPDGSVVRLPGPPVGFGAGSYFGGGGAIAAGDAGDVVVMGAGERAFDADAAPLLLAERPPGGAFVVQGGMSNDAGIVQNPTAAVASSGRAVIAWRSFGRGAEQDLIRAVVREPGSQFGEVTNLFSGDGGSLGAPPRAAAFPDGSLEVVFSHASDILIARAAPGSGLQTTRVLHTRFDNRVRDLAYAPGDDGRALLFYDAPPAHGHAVNALWVAARSGPGRPFSSPRQLMTTGDERMDVEAATVPGGAIVAALRETRDERLEVVAMRLDATGRPLMTQVVSRRERYRGPLPRRMRREASELELAAAPDGSALAVWRSGCSPDPCGALVEAAVAAPGGLFDAPAVVSRLGDAPVDLRADARPDGGGDVLWSGLDGGASRGLVVHSPLLRAEGPGPAVAPPRVAVRVTRSAARSGIRTGRVPVTLRCDRPCAGLVDLPGVASRVTDRRAGDKMHPARIVLPNGGSATGRIVLTTRGARRALSAVLRRGPLTVHARVTGAQGALTFQAARAR